MSKDKILLFSQANLFLKLDPCIFYSTTNEDIKIFIQMMLLKEAFSCRKAFLFVRETMTTHNLNSISGI